MTGRHHHCDLLTRGYHLFGNLSSGSIDTILRQFYPPLRTRQKPRFYVFVCLSGNKMTITLYQPYTILL